jgi:hypothetical protein
MLHVQQVQRSWKFYYICVYRAHAEYYTKKGYNLKTKLQNWPTAKSYHLLVVSWVVFILVNDKFIIRTKLKQNLIKLRTSVKYYFNCKYVIWPFVICCTSENSQTSVLRLTCVEMHARVTSSYFILTYFRISFWESLKNQAKDQNY